VAESTAAASGAAAAEADRVDPKARTALAVLAAAALASLVVPGSRAGLGLTVASMAILAATVVGAEGRRSRMSVAMLVAAELLLLAPIVRDATWLVTYDLAIALAVAAAALSGASTWAGMGRAWTRLCGYVVRGPAAIARVCIGQLPVLGPESYTAIVRGGLLTLGLLTVFAALFASADGVFAHLFGSLSPDLAQWALPARVGVAIVSVAIGGGLALLARRGEDEDRDGGGTAFDELIAGSPPSERKLRPAEWAFALGALTALFAGFVAIQFVVFFGGQEHVVQTAGLTYSEYARQGFGQLLVVAGLVLAVVAGALRFSRTDTARQALLLHALLAGLCILTLVVLASAVHRLDLYVDVFGATRLRFIAAATCALIACVLVSVTVALFSPRRAWLAPTVVMTTALVAITATAMNPDGTIAGRNVDRFRSSGALDRSYNSSLSADATPALTELPPPLATDVLSRQRSRLASPDGVWGFSEARRRARAALEDLSASH
jgi:hypothetical protein